MSHAGRARARRTHPSGVRLASSIFCCLLSSACLVQDAIDDKIEDEVRRRVADGENTNTNTNDNAPPLTDFQLNSVQPNRGVIEGGEIVDLIGMSFVEGLRVRFGSSEVNASEIDVINENRMQVTTPPGGALGPVDVQLINAGDLANILPSGFEYFEAVEVYSIDPVRGSTEGGTIVTINGKGFVAGTEVSFGNEEPVIPTLVSSTRILATTPPLAPGLFSVRVSNVNGADTLIDAFQTFEPVTISSVSPVSGPLTGGTGVLVRGTGFVPGTRVQLGVQVFPNAETNFAETEASVVTGPGLAEGTVDIVVDNANGEATLTDGFVYIDTNDSSDRIIAVTPSTDLLEGGRTVTLTGVGFTDPSATVTFGATEADCIVISDTRIQCDTPPGSAGTVDIRVQGVGLDVQLDAAFSYIPLRLDTIVRNQGAIAGGTYVSVYGEGFGADTKVFFDGRPGTQYDLESEFLVHLRTPKGDVGPADIRVETQGVSREEQQLFTYFDPAATSLWTDGGFIDRALNVTVINSGTNERLPGAFVMLGTDWSTGESGLTDQNGQITLSSPSVVGPQTVTAAYPNCASFSYIDVNATNVRLLVQCAPEPASGGGGGGGALPIIRGTVKRIKDQYNFADDIVQLTTSYVSFSFPLPDPGPGATLINNGEFEMVSRVGDMVIIALAGKEINGQFVPHAMGFKPFFTAEPDQIYEDVEITIDTPINQTMVLNFDNPPLKSTVDSAFVSATPDTASAFVYYDFGYMGLHPMADIRIRNVETLFVQMPKRLPGSLLDTPFNIDAGVFVGQGTPIQLSPPQSEVSMQGWTDTTEPITVGPFLGTPVTRYAEGGVDLSSPWSLGMDLNRPFLPSANVHVIYEGAFGPLAWMILTPPNNVDFQLPAVPAGTDAVLDLNAFSFRWDIYRMYSEGIQFNRMDLYDLFDWSSRSVAISDFTSSF